MAAWKSFACVIWGEGLDHADVVERNEMLSVVFGEALQLNACG